MMRDQTMCDQVQENLELYALGVLEGNEANAVAEHLSAGCASCKEALERAMEQNLAVAKSVPLVDPPARLRNRVREAIAPAREMRRSLLPWALLAAAAMIAIAAGLMLQARLQHERQVAETLLMERARLAKTVEIIRAPGTRDVAFNDAKAHGTIYVHQKLGLAMVIDQLPHAPDGWNYESWLVPKDGAPRPVEPFQPDGSGRAVTVVPGPVEVADVGAVAVSMERQDARPTKPTTFVFAAKI